MDKKLQTQSTWRRKAAKIAGGLAILASGTGIVVYSLKPEAVYEPAPLTAPSTHDGDTEGQVPPLVGNTTPPASETNAGTQREAVPTDDTTIQNVGAFVPVPVDKIFKLNSTDDYGLPPGTALTGAVAAASGSPTIIKQCTAEIQDTEGKEVIGSFNTYFNGKQLKTPNGVPLMVAISPHIKKWHDCNDIVKGLREYLIKYQALPTLSGSALSDKQRELLHNAIIDSDMHRIQDALSGKLDSVGDSNNFAAAKEKALQAFDTQIQILEDEKNLWTGNQGVTSEDLLKKIQNFFSNENNKKAFLAFSEKETGVVDWQRFCPSNREPDVAGLFAFLETEAVKRMIDSGRNNPEPVKAIRELHEIVGSSGHASQPWAKARQDWLDSTLTKLTRMRDQLSDTSDMNGFNGTGLRIKGDINKVKKGTTDDYRESRSFLGSHPFTIPYIQGRVTEYSYKAHQALADAKAIIDGVGHAHEGLLSAQSRVLEAESTRGR